NPRALLCATGVQLAEPPRRLGGGERHVSLRLIQHRVALRAVAFGRAEWHDELAQIQEPIDIAFRPVINDYKGMRNVELHLVDWRRTPQLASLAFP
ncbi:MAG: single-stranded-DNA-specific exonuclease RecJ, partial [Pirellulaceae bacterium]